MTSSLPVDLELENFGWSEKLIPGNSLESYNSIVDFTMCVTIFLAIYIYCLVEFFLELIIKDLTTNRFISQVNIPNFSAIFVYPRLTT